MHGSCLGPTVLDTVWCCFDAVHRHALYFRTCSRCWEVQVENKFRRPHQSKCSHVDCDQYPRHGDESQCNWMPSYVFWGLICSEQVRNRSFIGRWNWRCIFTLSVDERGNKPSWIFNPSALSLIFTRIDPRHTQRSPPRVEEPLQLPSCNGRWYCSEWWIKCKARKGS